MITVKNVMSAVSAALSGEFEGYEVFLDDVKQGLFPPCFTVACGSSLEQVLGKRYRRDFDIRIHFFPGSENEHTECADAEERLFSALRYINVDGDLLRGEDMSRNYSDGVLTFNVRFGTYVLDSEKSEAMGDLKSCFGGALKAHRDKHYI